MTVATTSPKPTVKTSAPTKLDAAFEDVFGEVALGGVGDDGYYSFARAELLCNFQRGCDGGASAGSSQHAFLGSQGFHRPEGIIVHHHENFVADRAIERLWDEACANTFDFVRAGRAAAENRSLGLDRISQNAWKLLLQIASYAGERSGSSAADHDGIDAPIHLLENFAGGGFVVVVGIGEVFELSGHERRGIGGDQSLGLADGALHALCVGSTSHLGAEGAHDLDLFLGEALGHEQLHFIAAIDADEREADAGVSGGRFDDSAARRELAVLLGAADDPDGCAIFHTTAGVQVFELGEYVSRSRGDQALQLQHGSLADQLGDVVGDSQAGHFLILVRHLTGYEGSWESSMQGLKPFS